MTTIRRELPSSHRSRCDVKSVVIQEETRRFEKPQNLRMGIPRSQVQKPTGTFVRVNELLGPCGHAAGSVETPLTWPVSAAVSHDHVCNSEWRVPSGQLWPSGLSTVIVQRSPASCASPLHPLELVMCATQPPAGGHVDLAVQEVWAPGAPLRFNE
jgi:hypothetical protein